MDGFENLSIRPDVDVEAAVFFSTPTSAFTIDKRVPKVIRELLTEAEGCRRMGFLTGASACMRKAIYEFLMVARAEGADYDSRIRSLKGKYPDISSVELDVCHWPR